MLAKGRVTLPSEENYFKETMAIAKKWGADAVRDSDGTQLDPQLAKSDLKIYRVYFPSRGHNAFIQQHMDECPQIFLMSRRTMATQPTVAIDFLQDYYQEQVTPNYVHEPKKYWEVIDRTTGETVPADRWEIDRNVHRVTIHGARRWHEYTVSFLAFIIWDPVEMYNHLTNQWTDKPHQIPFDVLQLHAHQFLLQTMKQWLQDHPEVDVVRFTTFFYQFSLVFNQYRKEKFVDWFGYGASVSPLMLRRFAKEKGYALRAEDFVDEGYYNSSFRIPSAHYLAYIDFVQRLVTQTVRQLTDLVHTSGKEAMMFLGDQWIGTEPYGRYFQQTGLDAVVGSVGDGTTLRMIADIPHVNYTEGRFLPYFFPDTFYEGNDPSAEALANWIKARRAILRSPIDRMGYGGYLSLANKFPHFIDTISQITNEFREIHDQLRGAKPYAELKVAILNSWGKLRTWQAFTVAHALYCKEAYSYYGVLESLSGMNVAVSFISFDDLLQNGIDPSIDVIINAGAAGTAFSGGGIWRNARLTGMIHQWIYQGGGFIGVGEPAALSFQGKYFQLAQALGVDKEIGFSLSTDKYFKTTAAEHFITADSSDFDFGEPVNSVYAIDADTEILEYSHDEVHLAAHSFGRGRAVYMAGLPYRAANTRLLMRSLFYAAHKESEMFRGFSSNFHCEVNLYPAAKKYCVVNNTGAKQKTGVYLDNKHVYELELAPYEIVWRDENV
ncbi:MAG: 1,3-beta-galactosyl-N-acetylhexosamine phosphorylase [Sporolactobacillus sp.]|jgi:1,3-beta-galactosyl-N-acetylhexosamine phosphorylase|nr:1,3-beta-galactosyl-N-acetylhexosamine phosphorylase [Sporolactobacillus sp.]